MSKQETVTYKIGETYMVKCCGHNVKAELLGVRKDNQCGEYDMLVWKFICHEDGGRDLCLDFGQRWYIYSGNEFTNLKRAHEIVEN